MADDGGNDISLPKATIAKLVKEYIPSDLRTSAETTDKLLECCTEFVHLVSKGANTIAESEKKTTITPEYVLRALEMTGFQAYVEDVRATWEQVKEESKNAPKLAGRRTKAEAEGLSEQEQIRMQQELFAQARARSMSLAEAQESSARAHVTAHQQQQEQQGLMGPPPPHQTQPQPVARQQQHEEGEEDGSGGGDDDEMT